MYIHVLFHNDNLIYKKILSARKIRIVTCKAWNNDTEMTVINCCRKADFFHEDGPQDMINLKSSE